MPKKKKIYNIKVQINSSTWDDRPNPQHLPLICCDCKLISMKLGIFCVPNHFFPPLNFLSLCSFWLNPTESVKCHPISTAKQIRGNNWSSITKQPWCLCICQLLPQIRIIKVKWSVNAVQFISKTHALINKLQPHHCNCPELHHYSWVKNTVKDCNKPVESNQAIVVVLFIWNIF